MINKLTLTITLGTLLLLLSGVFGVMVFGVRNRVNTKVDGYKFEILDDTKEAWVQSNNNYLNIIMLRMKNPGIENMGDFKFELLDEESNLVREIKFNGMNIGDPGDMRFQFEPIVDSFGKEYKIEITPDGAQPLVSIEVGKDGNMSYTSYFKTVNKTQATQSFLKLIQSKIVSNILFFSAWSAMLLGLIIFGLKSNEN